MVLDQDSLPCPCRDHEPSTFDRPELFVPVIVIMFASVAFLFALADLPFCIQIGSLIPYTAFVFLTTFSAQHQQQPYFFECPIVHQTMPRLVRRHVGFLVALVLLETIAFHLVRYMPLSWLSDNGKSDSPFAITLCILCFCIAFVQTLSNRSLLERSHLRQHAPIEA
jgi:hypothetical protein